MEPTINIKELIIIKEKNNYDIRDIVTYKDKSNNLVTHRIVGKVGEKVITRGDNNSISDEPININRIEGKVCYHSGILGEFFLYWIKPIIIIIISILLISLLKKQFFRRKEHEKS